MADVKVSALTALTGANLANGDQFLVTDVGSPNVSKSITADQLAQGSQFSSRYVRKASDDDYRWIDAGCFQANLGSPTRSAIMGSNYVDAAWLLDSASTEVVTTSIFVPPWWQTMTVTQYWCNTGTSAGNVKIGTVARFAGSGDIPDSASYATPADPTTVVAASTTKGAIVATTFSWSLTNVNTKPMWINVYRNGGDAADTLAADIGFYGMLLTRTS